MTRHLWQMSTITLALITIGLSVGSRGHGQDATAEQARDYLQSILYTRNQVDGRLSGEDYREPCYNWR